MKKTNRVPLFAAIFLILAQVGYAADCGDVDKSGSITGADALRVLRVAVGLPSTLQCPCAEDCSQTTTTSTTTTTQIIIGDECFADIDCWDDHPGWHCGGLNGTTCVECEQDDHCSSGFDCSFFACVPE